MHKHFKNDERGVALILELILIAAVIGIVGFVGYRAYQAKNTKPTAQTEQEETDKEFKSKIGYALTIPKNMIVAESTDAKSFDLFTLKTSDADKQIGMAIYLRTADTQTDGTPEGYKGIDIGGRALTTTTVAGLPAVKVADDPKLHETYWVYDQTKTKVVRVNIVAETEAELATYKKTLETLRFL